MIDLLAASPQFGVAFAKESPNGVCASLVQYETQPKRLEILHSS